ncbi:MAG: biotin/lipoyl-containing protein [Ignavibacteriaceae bacterium]
MEKQIDILEIDTTLYETTYTPKYLKRKPYVKNDPSKIPAFIPGIIRKIFVYEGKRLKTGEKILILEAMKMENAVCVPFDAVIKKIHVKEADVVVKNQLLIELEAIIN